MHPHFYAKSLLVLGSPLAVGGRNSRNAGAMASGAENIGQSPSDVVVPS